MRGLCAHLLVTASAIAAARGDFAALTRPWFSDTRQRVMTRLLQSEVYGGLNATFRQVLAGGNLSTVTMSDMYMVPNSLWNKVGAGPVSTLPKSVMDYVVNSRVSTRVKVELSTILSANVTQADAIKNLQTVLRNQNVFSLNSQMLLDLLGDPGAWTAQNITNMKHLLFYLPITMLTRVTDQGAQNELLQDLKRCMVSFNREKSSSCPSSEAEARGEGSGPRAQMMSSLQTWLFLQLYQKPDNWDISFYQMMDLNTLPPLLVSQLRNEVFMSRKDPILTVVQSNSVRREAIGREVVRRILNDSRIMIVGVTDAQKVLKRLEAAYLTTMVYITDLPNKVLDANNEQLRQSMEQLSAKAIEDVNVDGKVVEFFMKKFSSWEYIGPELAQKYGSNLLALLPATSLSNTLQRWSEIPPDDVIKLTKAIRNTAGISAGNKMLQVRDKIYSSTNNNQFLYNQDKLPGELLSTLPLRYLWSLYTSNLDILLRDVRFNPALLFGLVLPLSSMSIRSLPPNALEVVSTSRLEDLRTPDLQSMANLMPASSKIGLLASRKVMDAYPTTLKYNPEISMFLQASDVRKIPEQYILDELEYIQDSFPTIVACKVFKDKLVSRMKAEFAATTEEEVILLLTPSDIQRMPACVVAAFGANLLRRLDDYSKGVLLGKLVRSRYDVLRTDSISRPMIQVILEEGLEAQGRSKVMTGAEAQQYGELLLFASPDTLNSITVEGSCVALNLFNKLASSVLMPCLDSARRNAVSNLIVKCLGDDVTQWTNVSHVCCLLYALPSDQLSKVPPGALVLCACPVTDEMQYIAEADARDLDCEQRLGGDYITLLHSKLKVRELKEKAALALLDKDRSGTSGRRRRAASDISFCDRASVSGAKDFSTDELSAANPGDVRNCLSALGGRFMEDNKAQILAKKVKVTLSPRGFTDWTNAIIKDMNFITKGISPGDIAIMRNFVYPDDSDAVAVLGDERMMFSNEQRDAYANKVLSSWRSPSAMNARDIAVFNRLVCSMNATLINQFKNDELKLVIGILGRSLYGCDRDKVLAPLASRAKSFYSPTLNRAQIQEMGVLAAALPSKDVAGLPPDAMSGLSTLAMRTMSTDAVRVMTAEQFRCLQPTTALVMSGAQWGTLSAEQQSALSEVLIDRGAAATVVLQTSLLLATTLPLTALVVLGGPSCVLQRHCN